MSRLKIDSLSKKTCISQLIGVEMLHRGSWILMDAKGRECEPKGSPKVGAPKCPFYMTTLALFIQVGYPNGSLSHYKPIGHCTHNRHSRGSINSLLIRQFIWSRWICSGHNPMCSKIQVEGKRKLELLVVFNPTSMC